MGTLYTFGGVEIWNFIKIVRAISSSTKTRDEMAIFLFPLQRGWFLHTHIQTGPVNDSTLADGVNFYIITVWALERICVWARARLYCGAAAHLKRNRKSADGEWEEATNSTPCARRLILLLLEITLFIIFASWNYKQPNWLSSILASSSSTIAETAPGTTTGETRFH